MEIEAPRSPVPLVHVAADATAFGPGARDESCLRRRHYFTVKRSEIIPAMRVFDATEPLVSQSTRPATTVAPQALWLMNNPKVREWASGFARSIVAGPIHPFGHTVTRAYQLAPNRPTTTYQISALP